MRKVFHGSLHNDIAGVHTCDSDLCDFGFDQVHSWDDVDAASLDSYPNLANSRIQAGNEDPTVEEPMGGFRSTSTGWRRL